MSNVSGPLKLQGKSSTTEIFSARGNLTEGDYTQVVVVDSTPQSLWVIYKTVDWDHGHPLDNPDVNKVVEVSDGTVTMDGSIISAQGFDITRPGIIIFEHTGFRGYGTKFDQGQQDITGIFTQGSVPGASSAIITGGRWTFCKGFNYREPLIINGQTELGPGKFVCFSDANDMARSVQYIGPA